MLRAETFLVALVALAVLLAGCGTGEEPSAAGVTCADVIGVDITPGEGGYRISATVSSPDTGWEQYADAWVVRTPDGELLATRELLHPHVDEQPFTRSVSGVDIPAEVGQVEVAARDSVAGFCGEVVVVDVPSR